jgi:FRG domain-containing protein
MADDTGQFAEKPITTWTGFTSEVFDRKNWIFRGQSEDKPLRTTLERGLLSWGIGLTRGPAIERALVREFRRRLRREEYTRVEDNTLYCLALMQHHGEKLFGKIKAEEHDKERTDKTFVPMYMPCDHVKSFVHQENPFLLNERLTIQQGLFLCPGNTGQPFLENLCAMDGSKSEDNVYKLRLKLTHTERAVFARMLKRMNLSSAALFPGLDGFARSLGEHLFHFNEIY